MDLRSDEVSALEQLPERASRRLAWAAAEGTSPAFPGPRLRMWIALAIIADRVRLARHESLSQASSTAGRARGAMNPHPVRSRGRALEVRSVPWWLARFLLRAGRPRGNWEKVWPKSLPGSVRPAASYPAEVGSG